MKTTRTIIILTALIALANTSYAQGRLEQNNPSNDDFAIHEMAFHQASKEISFAKAEIQRTEARLAALYLHTSQVDLINEIESGLKLWISPPSRSSLEEENMEMESWMTTPFESESFENDLTLESWMVESF